MHRGFRFGVALLVAGSLSQHARAQGKPADLPQKSTFACETDKHTNTLAAKAPTTANSPSMHLSVQLGSSRGILADAFVSRPKAAPVKDAPQTDGWQAIRGTVQGLIPRGGLLGAELTLQFPVRLAGMAAASDCPYLGVQSVDLGATPLAQTSSVVENLRKLEASRLLLQEGDEAYGQRNWVAALRKYEDASTMSPGSASAREAKERIAMVIQKQVDAIAGEEEQEASVAKPKTEFATTCEVNGKLVVAGFSVTCQVLLREENHGQVMFGMGSETEWARMIPVLMGQDPLANYLLSMAKKLK